MPAPRQPAAAMAGRTLEAAPEYHMKKNTPRRRARTISNSPAITPAEVAEAIDGVVAAAKRHGVPAEALVDAFVSATLKQFAPRGVGRRARLLSSLVQDFQSARELLAHADSEVLAAGRQVFRSDAAVALWLCTPARFADGKRPLKLLRTSEGRQKVASILIGLAHGNVI